MARILLFNDKFHLPTIILLLRRSFSTDSKYKTDGKKSKRETISKSKQVKMQILLFSSQFFLNSKCNLYIPTFYVLSLVVIYPKLFGKIVEAKNNRLLNVIGA